MHREREGNQVEIGLMEPGHRLERQPQRRQRRHPERQAARGFLAPRVPPYRAGQDHREDDREQIEQQHVLVGVRRDVAAQPPEPGQHQAQHAAE
ncbi:MAG: hypothetical protein DMD43_00445 [Gemmatimonadetes bacterium]|nr:MAG: hypothetical protein DMD43_00445 [Gemmatimonadota bacterium]